MAELGVSEEACALRLLMKHGRKALRHFTSMRQLESWPDTSIHLTVEYLLAKGAELVEDEDDPANTLAWAQKRLAEACQSNQDRGPHNRLVTMIQNSSKSTGAGSPSAATGAGSQVAGTQPVQGQWGYSPADDVRTVMQHVLRYGRDQQRRVVSYHPHCATAALAAAAGMGPQMRDVVHWMLAIGANVDGLDLRQLRKKRTKKKPVPIPALAEQLPAAAFDFQQPPDSCTTTSATAPIPAPSQPPLLTPLPTEHTIEPEPIFNGFAVQAGAATQDTAPADDQQQPASQCTEQVDGKHQPQHLPNGHSNHIEVVQANGQHPWHDSIQHSSCISDMHAYVQVAEDDSEEHTTMSDGKAAAKQVLVQHLLAHGVKQDSQIEVLTNGHVPADHQALPPALEPILAAAQDINTNGHAVHHDAHSNGHVGGHQIDSISSAGMPRGHANGEQNGHHSQQHSCVEDDTALSNPFMQSQKHLSKPHSHHPPAGTHHHQPDSDAASTNPFLTAQQQLAVHNQLLTHHPPTTASSNPFLTTQQAAQQASGKGKGIGEHAGDGNGDGTSWIWEQGVNEGAAAEEVETSWLDYLDESAEDEPYTVDDDDDDDEGGDGEEEEEEAEAAAAAVLAQAPTSHWVLSPLAEAAASGDKYVVELLLEVHGANPTAHGNLAETAAYNAGHLHIAKIIYEKALAQTAAARGMSPHCEDGAAGGAGGSYTPAADTYQYVTLGDWFKSVMPKLPTWQQLLYGSPAQQSWQGRGRAGYAGAGSRAHAGKRVLYMGLAIAGTAALGYLLFCPGSQGKDGQEESKASKEAGSGSTASVEAGSSP